MLSHEMAQAMRSPNRNLSWLAWFETSGADVYAWSGMQPIPWNGHTYVGVGLLYSVSTVDRGDAMAWRQQSFTLNGLPGDAIAGMEESVKGRLAMLWIGALNSANQIIRDPLLVKELKQDTQQREITGDGKVNYTLNTFEALPRFDKPTGRKWSHESQLERHAGDYGLALTSRVAKSGQPIDWRQG
jgi:hypothetical protein